MQDKSTSIDAETNNGQISGRDSTSGIKGWHVCLIVLIAALAWGTNEFVLKGGGVEGSSQKEVESDD